MECVDKHNKKHPAYKCSGIIIRGVRENTDLKYAWSLKPGNKESKSFSAAFLREDTPFEKFPRGYDTGFIIYPHWKTPEKENTYKVYCAFPLDAHTDGRAGHGCERLTSDTTGSSRHCNDQGITSLDKWKSHYHGIMSSWNRNFVVRQCAFDMTKSTAARDFAIALKANSYLRYSNEYSFRNNELLIHMWDENKPKLLPIEAFFYLIDSPGAYATARKHQRDFRKGCGGNKPIVGIRLPSPSNPNIYVVHR